jgi:hypothetical protein
VSIRWFMSVKTKTCVSCFTDHGFEILHSPINKTEETESEDLKMTHFRIACAMIGMALPATSTYAAASTLDDYKSLCAQNVQCSAEMTDKGMEFTLRKAGHTDRLLCNDQGVCEFIAARGSRYRVQDIESRLTAK